MAAADTARLIAQLVLDDKGFTKGLSSADKKLGQLESTAFRVGQNIGQGTKAAIGNLAKLGVVAAGGLAVAVKTGLSDLAELESAVTSVDGAIETLGLTGQVTGKQVADWANEIEADVGAAFDDKAITAATATLLRYGKVTPKNLRPAMEVMTDLAAKTGDVESASELLAKAMADPAKAAGKLARIGIILTDQQKEQIKAMTEAGDTAGAQAKLLDILAESTKGAARASQGPYQRALSTLNDVAEDARKALAEGFLPVIEKVASRLSKAMGNPAFINGIREFGQTLAAGLDDLIDIAANLPWTTIGDSLRIAGAGAKAVLQAFTSLPPWIQTAVITGWGLNKLTGGALGGIVGELGKGLIKGVLGMNAGVVNINAGVVNGAGGVPGAGGTPGGKGGPLPGAIKTIAAVSIVGVTATAAADLAGVTRDSPNRQIDPNTGNIVRTVTDVGQKIVNLQNAEKALLDRADAGDKFAAQQLVGVRAELDKLRGELIKSDTTQAQRQVAATERAEATAKQNADAISNRFQADSASERAAIARASSDQKAAQAQTTHAAQQAAAAIRDKDLSVKVNNYNTISTSVSVKETIDAQTTFKSYYKTQS